MVYNFTNAQTFNEILFYPSGRVEMREIRSGQSKVIAAGSYAGAGQWLDIELRRLDGKTTLFVNGRPLFSEVVQSAAVPGRVGLVTRKTQGEFDELRILRPLYRWPFIERFRGTEPSGWQTVGNWAVADGIYASNVQQTARSLIPPVTVPGQLEEFGLRARMFNPYGARGNVVGLAWNGGRNEVVFSPTGEARLNSVTSGIAKTLRSVPVPRLHKQWFEVEVDVSYRCLGDGWSATIKLNGATIFEGLQGADFFPEGQPSNGVGLVTHWTPGRFDDVELRSSPFPRGYAQYFDAPSKDPIIRAGAWQIANGVFGPSSVGRAHIALFPAGDKVDFVYRARVQNIAGGAENLSGLIRTTLNQAIITRRCSRRTGKCTSTRSSGAERSARQAAPTRSLPARRSTSSCDAWAARPVCV
ncbi:MAG: hypothetical protein ABW110_12210 [Steroidobacteraceae bacterium]